ncbi:MAG TPA: DUF1549 domain-containing protein, partial [Tepidisphaeraceae bacterium]|nr:DUF1549 domain-containing protein [Tepidisphaeraceae bacterium]
MIRRTKKIALAFPLLAFSLLAWFSFADEEPKPAKNPPLAISFPADGKIDFEKHVQPIFAATCYECHSAKKIKGKLRLDSKELAMKGGATKAGITPSKGKTSYLVQRLRGEGDEDRMPLDHDSLTAEQIRIIETWIDQGALWPDRASVKVEKHWAYIKPARPPLPKVQNEKWPRNPIDHFVLARLEKEGLTPSPESDRAHLIRRVSLDLTGLPPSPEEVTAFILDERPDAYERVVDRLLSSPHYGERWGRHWLDIARYADTNGYEKDAPRIIWAYRDWVINAVNRDLPFDQFVIEQFAGDMLETPTPQQRIATGFHRNTMVNEEGGIDVEEFRDKAIVDRVQTTSTALLGLTLQCANCHDHKYDQFSQKEYYQFFALLNNADESLLNVPNAETAQKRAEIDAKIAKAESELESKFPAQDDPIVWEVVNADDFESTAGAILSRLPDNSLLASGKNPGADTYTLKATINPKDVTHIRLEALTHPSLAKNGPGRSGADGNGNFVLTELRLTAAPDGVADLKPIPLTNAQAPIAQSGFPAASAIDGNPQTGWAVDDGSGKINENRSISFKLNEPIAGQKASVTFTIEQTYPIHPLGRFRLSVGRPQPVPPTNIPIEEQRRQLLALRMAAWEKQVAPKCVSWTVLEPKTFSRNYGGSITKLSDNSLLFTGDNYYRDEYKLEYQTDLKAITALRLEVLPHEDQPKGGPGRDTEGGFVLSEFTAAASPLDNSNPAKPIIFDTATTEPATPPTVARAIDGKRDTHWTINRAEAKPRIAVFRFKSPLANDAGTKLAISILQNYHQQANLGRVRISATTDTRGVEASGVPAEIEEALITPPDQRTPAQLDQLKNYFLS